MGRFGHLSEMVWDGESLSMTKPAPKKSLQDIKKTKLVVVADVEPVEPIGEKVCSLSDEISLVSPDLLQESAESGNPPPSSDEVVSEDGEYKLGQQIHSGDRNVLAPQTNPVCYVSFCSGLL